MFTENAIGRILPALPADKRQQYAPLLQSAAAEFGINNPLREASFIAQIAHESGGLTRLVENLNYSAQRLREVWPSRFTAASAQAAARQPERIANIVYANRLGNGPTASGDGWRYRGRGFIQLTGRENYRNFGRVTGFDLEGNPDQAADPATAFRIAAAFFKARGCNELADRQDTREITRRINGERLLGLAERTALFNRAKPILQAEAAPATRGIGAPTADEGRDVPSNLSRGIMPGDEDEGEAAADARAASRKGGAKKAAGGKGGAKKGGAKKAAGKKAAAKKAAKKAGAKKAAGKKGGAKKGGAKKAAARKGSAKKAAAKKGGAKKGGAKGGAKKGGTKKGGAKKGGTKKGR